MNHTAYEDRLKNLFLKGSSPDNAISACRATLGSLPLVVKALVEKTGKKIRIDISSRYSTGSTNCIDMIRLPMVPLPSDRDDATAYTKIAAFYYGLIHHEVGHINRSDPDAMRACPNALVAHLLNIIDDVWQELEHIKVFPASRKYLDGLMMAAAMRDFFPMPVETQHPTQIFTQYLLYRLRAEYRQDPVSLDLHAPAKKAMEAVFTKGVLSRMQPVLADFQNVRSSTDGLSLALRLYQFLVSEKEKAEEEEATKQQSSSTGQPSGSQQQDDGDDDENDADQSASGGNDAGQDADDSSDAGEDTRSEDASDEGDDDGRSNSDSDACDDDTQGSAGSQSSDPEALKKALEELLDDKNEDQAIADIHEKVKKLLEDAVEEVGSVDTINPGDPVMLEGVDGKEGTLSCGAKHDMGPAMAVSMPIRRLTIKELATLTDEDTSVSSQGRRISRRHLHRVATNDPRLFARTASNFSLDTGILLIEDVSASMQSDRRIEVASQACYAAATALYGIDGLDIGAMAFPGNGIILPFKKDPRSVKNNFQLEANGWSTPMHDGITFGTMLFRKLDRNRKIMVVLTDGEPDNPVLAATAVAVAQAQGIEVFGVGILTDSVKNIFPEWTVIRNINELPSRLVGLLKKKVFDSLQAA